MLALWPGRWDVLEEFDKQLNNFVWSGEDMEKKPRVDYPTLLRPKSKGGVGLISVVQRTMAKVGMTILWVAQERDQMLQSI